MKHKQFIVLIYCIQMCTKQIMAAIIGGKTPTHVGVELLSMTEQQHKEFNKCELELAKSEVSDAS